MARRSTPRVTQRICSGSGPVLPADPGGRVSARQRGVALAIVVWFLAAMSLLVSGIVFQAKVDTRMAQLHIARAKAIAAGDGAIQLFLAELAAASNNDRGARAALTREYVVGDRTVLVEVVPSAGLVNLQAASSKILAGLFHIRGQLDKGAAKTLADNVIKLRSGGSGIARLSAIEDLLRVDGVNRTLFDRLRDLVAVGGGRGGRSVDWAFAPAPLLEVQKMVDPGGIKEGARGGSAAQLGGSLRLDAYVQDGGQTWLRRRWVKMGAGESGSLPWHFSRTEVPRVVVKN
jgi:general secretion pathway protein K